MRAFGGATIGTTWAVKAVLPATTDLAALQAMVQRALDAVVAEMSPGRRCRISVATTAAPPEARTALPPATATVLRRAIAVAEASDGAFDPTLGRSPTCGASALFHFRVSRRWRPISPPCAPPAAGSALTLDGDALFQPGGLKLDLNGIAKGFGVDRGRRRPRSGRRQELSGRGRRRAARRWAPSRDGQPWWVELERPPLQGLAANDAEKTVVALHDLAVATSGDYRRFFEHDGRRYAHTLDPATGAPSANPTVSVTVLARDCMSADAWATALTVMPPDAALAFAADHGLAALIVSRGASGVEERLSPALQAMLD
ncbi:FAD:protein FMN transferase [Caulobacter segnis]